MQHTIYQPLEEKVGLSLIICFGAIATAAAPEAANADIDQRIIADIKAAIHRSIESEAKKQQLQINQLKTRFNTAKYSRATLSYNLPNARDKVYLRKQIKAMKKHLAMIRRGKGKMCLPLDPFNLEDGQVGRFVDWPEYATYKPVGREQKLIRVINGNIVFKAIKKDNNSTKMLCRKGYLRSVGPQQTAAGAYEKGSQGAYSSLMRYAYNQPRNAVLAHKSSAPFWLEGINEIKGEKINIPDLLYHVRRNENGEYRLTPVSSDIFQTALDELFSDRDK